MEQQEAPSKPVRKPVPKPKEPAVAVVADMSEYVAPASSRAKSVTRLKDGTIREDY